MKIIFFLFIRPLSYLPFSVLYFFSDLLYLVVYHLIGYRKKVVYQNLRNAFPEKPAGDINKIAKGFYRHLCDLIIEAIKLFHISESALIDRCRLINPALMNNYAAQGKGLVLVAGHYSNWEMAGIACDLQIPHQVVCIYTPLKNKFFNEQIRTSRSRFGMELCPKLKVKKKFEENHHKLTAFIFAADQSPTSARSAYWTRFLNQETGVMVGAEKYAKKYDQPVLFGKVSKIKRGYYTIEFIPLEDHPKDTSFGAISEKHTRLLEAIIEEQPELWLWSHRRWKKKR